VAAIHLVHVESDNVTLAIYAEVTGELSIGKIEGNEVAVHVEEAVPCAHRVCVVTHYIPGRIDLKYPVGDRWRR
jgi:hypothetical protein